MASDEKNRNPAIAPLMAVSRILILKGKQKKDDVLKALVKTLSAEEKFGPEDDLEWGILHREELMTTGIGNNIAVPHLSMNGIEHAGIALAVCPDGVSDYASLDGQVVKLVFMIISAKGRSVPHLRILASLSSLFYDGRLKAACLAAADPETCLKIIERAE